MSMRKNQLCSLVTRFGATLALILVASSCASTSHRAGSGSTDGKDRADSGANANAPENEADLEISPGFLIQLASPKDAKLNGSFRVQVDHSLDLPYDVSIDTDGLTLAKLRSTLAERYSPYFKTTPSLQVNIKQRRYYVEVAGGVAKPATHLVKKDTTLDDLISLSGGLTEAVSNGFARIEQGGGQVTYVDLHDYFRGIGADELPGWKGGDKVVFQKERPEGDSADALGKGSLYKFRSVQVLGEVKTPGEVTFRRGADAYYYLVRAGGPVQSSNLDRIELIRLNPNTKQRETISLGAISDTPAPKDGDLMIFHPYRQTVFEKGLQYVAAIAGVLSSVALLIIAL